MIGQIRQWLTSTGVWWLMAVGVAVLAAVPLFLGGFGDGFLNTRGGGDSPFLLQRTHQMVAALEAGQFPVRWMPDANYGYGYPFFNFYAPLAYYIAAVFKLVGFSYVGAIQATQLLGFIVAAWGMFGLAKRWTGHGSAAFLASVAYTFAPFHMVNVYVRGDSLSEFWAMAFYPLCLWSADVLIDRASGRTHNASHSILFALSFAGLILSHNISALIFTPFLALYMLIQVVRRNNRPELIATLLVAGVMGLMLSAFFWIPAIFEKDSVQLDEVTNGYFSYYNHFRPVGELLVQGSLGTVYDVANSRVFGMGLLQALLTVFAVPIALYVFVQWVRSRERRSFPILFVFALLLGGTGMILPVSAPLWEALPLVEYAQFPWRFLSVQAVATSLLIGHIIASVIEHRAEAIQSRGGVSTTVVTFILAAVFAALGMINLWNLDYLPVSDGEITAESLAQYEWFTGNIGTTISAEYLPKTMRPRPVTSEWLETGERHTAYVIEGDAKVEALDDVVIGSSEFGLNSHSDWEIEVMSDEATLILPTMYWDGWTVEVFDSVFNTEWSQVEITPSESGLIQLTVPGYVDQIRLTLGTTPTRRIAGTLSIVALMWVVYACFRLFKWKVFVAYILLALMLGYILPSLIRSGEPSFSYESDDLKTWDFDQMAYLHGSDVIDFTGGERLRVAKLSQPTITAGESFDVELRWDAGEVETAYTFSLVSPAVHRATEAYPVPVAAEYPFYLSRSTSNHTLTLPDDIPAGLYVPRLTFEDGSRALTPSGNERGDLFLEPVRVLSAPSETVDVIEDEDGITIRVNEVVMEDGDLVVDLSYLTTERLTANYQLALSVNDARTYFYGKHDSQPGYGFRPASSWTPNTWVDDRIVIDWTADDGEPPYMLSAKLYYTGWYSVYLRGDRMVDTEPFERPLATLIPPEDGDGVWDVVPFDPLSELPEGVSSYEAVWYEDDTQELIELAGFSVESTDENVLVMLYWRELDDHDLDLTHFVHLIDEAGGMACEQCQHDSIPMVGAYNTADWETGEIVADPAIISLNDVPPGTYRLRVGLYERNFPALPVVDSDDTFVLLPDRVIVTE